jgi:hypothetical protein
MKLDLNLNQSLEILTDVLKDTDCCLTITTDLTGTNTRKRINILDTKTNITVFSSSLYLDEEEESYGTVLTLIKDLARSYIVVLQNRPEQKLIQA